MRLSSSTILSGGLAFLLLAPPAFATEGYFADGYGTQSKGMAGVGYALPEDSLSVASNPASAVFVGNRADFDADFFVPQRSSTITGNAFGADQGFAGNKIKIFVIPEGGVAYQLPHNLAFDLAIYGNGGLDTNYLKNPYARFGATGAAGVDLEQIFISPTVAWQFAPGQSVGVSFNIVDEFFRDGGLAIFSGFSADPTHVNHQGEDSSFGYGVRVGYLGQITPWLSVGASWQSKTYAGGFHKYAGLFANQGGFDVPSTYGIGVQASDMYFRTDGEFWWYRGGSHNDANGNPGGGLWLMHLFDNGNLAIAGTLTQNSDRNVKGGFQPVDVRVVLEKVAAMPFTRWHYTNDPSTPHLGPMAQDFYAAFGLGEDDKHITTVDEGGVALAAIQGLHQEVKAKDAKIAQLEKELAEVKSTQIRTTADWETRFNALQKAVAGLTRQPENTLTSLSETSSRYK